MGGGPAPCRFCARTTRLPIAVSPVVNALLGWFDSRRTLGFILVPMVTLISGGLPASAPVVTFLVLFVSAWIIQRVALQFLARGRAPLWPATVFEFVRLPAGLRATTALASARPRPFQVTHKGRTDDSRRAMPMPWLLVILLVASLCTGLWYAATITGLTPLTYSIPWAAHAAMIWLVFNAAFLGWALYRIRSSRFGSERRAAVRFIATGVVLVDEVVGEVGDISLTGVAVSMPSPVTPGSYVCSELPGLIDESVRGVVRSSVGKPNGHDIGLEFAELAAPLRAQLALQLFQTGFAPRMHQPVS